MSNWSVSADRNRSQAAGRPKISNPHCTHWRPVLIGAVVALMTIALAAVPAHATVKVCDYFPCGGSLPKTVTTYNYASGYVHHTHTVAGVDFFHSFGADLPGRTRYWSRGFDYVDGWRVYGTVQENNRSGVTCFT